MSRNGDRYIMVVYINETGHMDGTQLLKFSENTVVQKMCAFNTKRQTGLFDYRRLQNTQEID